MRTIVSFLKKETTLAGILIFCILFLNLLPDLIKARQTPAGHVYHPVHNCAIDYALYLSYEKQGLDGQNVLYDLFTTEPHPGKWVNPFYLVLGRIWRITGIQDPHIVYHATRMLLAVTWALLLYWYIRQSLPTKLGRLLALFFVLYGASFPIYHPPGSLLSVTTYTAWWSELDPIVRATFLPAHLMGHILMLTTIILYTRHSLSLKVTIGAVISGFFAGLFHTPSLLLPLLLLPAWAITTGNWKRLLVLCITLPISAISFLILSQQFSSSPWTEYWEYEKMSFAIPLGEYILGLGPIAILGMLGALVTLKNPKTRVWILWAGIGIFAVGTIRFITSLPFPFMRSLLISNIRFLQIAINVPLSLLTSMFLVWVYKQFGKKVGTFLFLFLVCLTMSIYPGSLYINSTNMYQGLAYQYPTKGWWDAVQWLEYGKKEKAVLSLPFAGAAIGGYVNRTAFVGRPYSTLNLYPKTDTAWALYTGTMPVCTAFEFLTSNRIEEIFYGYDEKTAGGDLSIYPFIKLKQQFQDTQLYEFTGVRPAECTQ